MADYASVNLCVELYDLSGWHSGVETSPTYDLGYLVRQAGMGFRDLSYHTDGRWIARSGAGTGRFLKSARTPEDAVAKLCIELYKRSILTREKQGS